MKKLWVLTKMQMGMALSFLSVRNYKKGKKQTKGSMVAMIIFTCLLLFTVSFTYNYSMGFALKTFGVLDQLPAVIAAVTCVTILMTTISKVQAVLFGFRDYDIIMALPVKSSTIVASRIFILYFINLIFTVILMVPCFAAYAILGEPMLYFYLVAVLIIPFMPLIPLTIASIVGTLIAFISSRSRHKNIVTIILLLAFFSAIMVLSFGIQDETQIVNIGNTISEQIQRLYPPVKMLLAGLFLQDYMALLQFIVISVVIFIVFCIITGKLFRSIHSRLLSISAHRDFKLHEQKSSGQRRALFRKELKRFFSSVNYVMNCGIGLVMMTLGTIAVAFVPRETIYQEFGITSLGDSFPVYYLFFMIFCICMVFPSACTISLEGKQLWIAKTIPAPARVIYDSKIMLTLVLSIPFILLNATAVSIVLQPSVLIIILLYLLPTAVSLFMSVFGLAVNLKFPVFNWKNEITVIKQSVATLITVFTGMGIAAAVIAAYVFVPITKEIIMYVVTLLLLIITYGLYKRIQNRAEESLRKL